MSLSTILDAITASGNAAVAALGAEVDRQAAVIRAEAQIEAAAAQQAEQQAALQPLVNERYRRLQQARLQALRVVSAAQETLINTILEQTEERLATSSADPTYPAILRRLVTEALEALGSEIAGGQPIARVRLGDVALIQTQFSELMPHLEATLEGWGGVILTSSDGRVVVDNRLETRFERALPHLRQALARRLNGDESHVRL